MRLADARALVPDLVTTPGEPQADHRLIETLANWCDRYTPWVAIDPLGGAIAEEGIEACSTGGFGGDAGLLLDVTGCAHLFGQGEAGERALLADLTERLARHDLTCRAAMADTAGAAWALARFAERQADLFCPPRGHRQALAALPVEGLRLDAPIMETFLKLGLRRIGDLYPLPRAPLARRFGDQPLTRLDQALGTIVEPIEPRRTPPAFRTRLAFVEPIGRPEDIAAATSRLLAALCRQFEQAGVGARRLEIALYRVDGSVDRTAIGTSRPNRDNPKLMKLFEEKLGELDPGFGVELMILAAPEVEAWEGTQDALPDAGAIAASLGEDGTIDLADRLALRLGPENVVRLLPRDSHLPERVQTTGAAAKPASAGAWKRVAGMKGAQADAAAAAARAGRRHGPRARRSALGLPLAPACPSHRARRGARARGRRMVAAASRRQPAAGQHRAALSRLLPRRRRRRRPLLVVPRRALPDGGQRPADGPLVPPWILRMKKNPLTIRGLDDKVIENLKARARTRRHSLEAELREILSQAARQPLVLDPLAEADRIAAMTPLVRPPMAEERPLLCAGGKP